MRKSFWFILCVLVQSCSSNYFQDIEDNATSFDENFISDLSFNLEDLSKFQEVLSLSGDNRVTMEDILAVENTIYGDTHKKAIVLDDISPIVTEDNDTLLFAVNYPEGGYKVYSSDNRLQPVIVESPNGRFEPKEGENAIWLSLMVDNILLLKESADTELMMSKDEIYANKVFWALAKDPTSLIMALKGKNPTTRSIAPDPSGHYEYYSTFHTFEAYDSIPHLTTTRWHQSYPFNNYCPYKSDWSERVPAGCVPIAGAQLLYYLHNTFGYPTEAPLTATCIGNKNNYVMNQSDFSTTTWNQIRYDYTKAAPMIANLGTLSQIDYGNNSSSASLTRLAEDAFPVYGVGCDHQSYNYNSVKTSLLQSKPVIVGAYASRHHVLGIPTDYYNGHAFIIDGYKRVKEKITTICLWVPDGMEPSECEETITITYLSPEIGYFRINWGWGWPYYDIDFKNEVWYSSDEGHWKTYHYDDEECEHPDSLTFQYEKKMLINYRPIN